MKSNVNDVIQPLAGAFLSESLNKSTAYSSGGHFKLRSLPGMSCFA